MNRDELVAALSARYRTLSSREDMDIDDLADWLVERWEPLIRADERESFTRLADGWNDEASRYRGYAVGSSNPVVHKSIAQTLDQCAVAIRAVGAGPPQGSRVEAGTETSVQPGAIGPDTHTLADLRAQVEALPQDGGGRVWRADVLALLDGT